MTKITTLFIAGLTTLFLGTAAPSADAQGGFLHVGDGGFSVGVRTDRVAFGINTGFRQNDFGRCRGHVRTYSRRVWRQGYYDTRWVPGYYEYRYNACGGRTRYFVRGYHEKVWVRGHWDTVRERRRSYCSGGFCRN